MPNQVSFFYKDTCRIFRHNISLIYFHAACHCTRSGSRSSDYTFASWN